VTTVTLGSSITETLQYYNSLFKIYYIRVKSVEMLQCSRAANPLFELVGHLGVAGGRGCPVSGTAGAGPRYQALGVPCHGVAALLGLLRHQSRAPLRAVDDT